MYILLLFSFSAVFFTAYIITNITFNNRVPAFFIVLSFFLYILPTIAGIIGILGPYILIIFSIGSLLITIFVYRVIGKAIGKSTEFNSIYIKYFSRPKSLEVALFAVPLICSVSWISIFAVQSFMHKIVNYYIPPLPWDVVEYHFPHLINAIQSGSLWTTIWAHYPMGCEMFHSWGFTFLRNDALLYSTHFFFCILFIIFSCFVLRTLCFKDPNAICGSEIISYLILIILLLIFPPLWDMQFNQIGKNDIAMSAFAMAALYFFLKYMTLKLANESFCQNLLLLGIALGIMSGIKPQGILYSIFFLGLLVKDAFFKKLPWYSVGLVCLFILLIAGFWYLRPLIMLGTIPPSGLDRSIIFNINKGVSLFLTGRENIIFSSSIVYCIIMGVIWKNKDAKMKVANYTLAGSIVIFFLTPFSNLNGYMQLRLSPATIPLVIIIAIATFLHLIVRGSEEIKVDQFGKPIPWAYRRGALLAGFSFGFTSLVMVAIPFWEPMKDKSRWVWTLDALIMVCMLAVFIYIYNSVKAQKNLQLIISKSLIYAIIFIVVVFSIFFQEIHYKSSGDLPGYNEGTSVYRWVYQNIRGKTICLFGLRPYGLYGKGLTNKVIYGGYSFDTKLRYWLFLVKKEKANYLVIGRDYDQHKGWYDFKPFPRDIGKILSMPNAFKLVFSDNHAMIFRVEPSFFTHS
jgi:hypothetical protein